VSGRGEAIVFIPKMDA